MGQGHHLVLFAPHHQGRTVIRAQRVRRLHHLRLHTGAEVVEEELACRRVLAQGLDPVVDQLVRDRALRHHRVARAGHAAQGADGQGAREQRDAAGDPGHHGQELARRARRIVVEGLAARDDHAAHPVGALRGKLLEAARVVLHEHRVVAQLERVGELADEQGHGVRRDLGAGAHGRVLAPVREVRHDAPHGRAEFVDDVPPHRAVLGEPVEENDGRAVASRVLVRDRAHGEVHREFRLLRHDLTLGAGRRQGSTATPSISTMACSSHRRLTPITAIAG